VATLTDYHRSLRDIQNMSASSDEEDDSDVESDDGVLSGTHLHHPTEEAVCSADISATMTGDADALGDGMLAMDWKEQELRRNVRQLLDQVVVDVRLYRVVVVVVVALTVDVIVQEEDNCEVVEKVALAVLAEMKSQRGHKVSGDGSARGVHNKRKKESAKSSLAGVDAYASVMYNNDKGNDDDDKGDDEDSEAGEVESDLPSIYASVTASGKVVPDHKTKSTAARDDQQQLESSDVYVTVNRLDSIY
jgi:hypothetical protein